MREIAVIGGGLGGIVAALTAARRGCSVTIFDQGLPDAGGRLGGFAKFSGAKFSLLPAGQGLIPVAGSEARLRDVTGQVLTLLGIERKLLSASADIADVELTRSEALLRSYESILLSPTEVDAMIDRLTEPLHCTACIRHEAIASLIKDGAHWQLTTIGGTTSNFHSVLFAGGRTGSHLLLAAGAKPQRGRGLDVGVRIEFLDKVAVAGLRSLGPDAKILHNRCRTFCLNSPGRIYHYEFHGIAIPGGVVADNDEHSANFGILCRCSDKESRLKILIESAKILENTAISEPDILTGIPSHSLSERITSLFGSDVSNEISEFVLQLATAGLVDWSLPHKIHFPLLDWHWDVFGLAGSARTTLRQVFVIGDSAGHARGLLQAAISGQLAAEEAMSDATP